MGQSKISDHTRAQVLAYYKDGMPVIEIAARCGVNRKTVHQAALKAGISRARNNKKINSEWRRRHGLPLHANGKHTSK